jgi:hypothetical protein
MLNSKSEKILMSCLNSIGANVDNFNKAKTDGIKIATINGRSIDDEINSRLLALQGLKGVITLISRKEAEKNNLNTDKLKAVKLALFDGQSVKRYYTAFMVSEKEYKKIEAEKVSITPLKADNTREKSRPLFQLDPAVQMAEIVPANNEIATRVDSLECKLNQILSALDNLNSKKKK